ncbi:MAG: NTF2 fold immunity protein [Terracidiphilus sp.]
MPDTNTAIAIAYVVAVPIYGKKEMDQEKPFRAELENGAWTILGTLHCASCMGGTLFMQIDKASGKILFLTHTQ